MCCILVFTEYSVSAKFVQTLTCLWLRWDSSFDLMIVGLLLDLLQDNNVDY